MGNIKPLDTIIILNGPPNVGKDTIAEGMQEFGFHQMAFKTRLYLDTVTHFNAPIDEFMDRATDRYLKEQSWLKLALPTDTDYLQLLSPREALIHVSENVIKPLHGDQYYGEQVVETALQHGYQKIVMSDGGFPEEVIPLYDAFEHVIICRLHREGCSFEGDSRSYLPDGKNTFDIHLETGKVNEGIIDIAMSLDLVSDALIF